MDGWMDTTKGHHTGGPFQFEFRQESTRCGEANDSLREREMRMDGYGETNDSCRERERCEWMDGLKDGDNTVGSFLPVICHLVS